jgi:pimeloyl-ACP methyl ester carboxylesterase
MRGTPRRALVALATCAFIAVLAPAAGAHQPGATAPKLDWQPCGDIGGGDVGAQCATATVPLDYDKPRGATIDLHLAKSPATDQAHRLGSLFFNLGGPGADAALYIEFLGSNLFPALNQRYDIIGMDPRGVGQSQPSIDCKANQETEGIYSQPFTTPDNLDPKALVSKDLKYIGECVSLNKTILAHASTANVARDMDLLRKSLGEAKLNYLGYSYGTFLGATYASLFPKNYNRMVLDGPVDATDYINDPLADLSAQTGGFERAIARFFQACAVDQVACSGFGGTDPWGAFDELVEKANESPIPAGGADPRPVDGDDILTVALYDSYAKQYWGELAFALASAAKGDGTMIRALVNGFYGNNGDGTFDPGTDRYFTIGAVEQRYPRADVGLYLRAGKRSWSEHEWAWSNNGYVELNYGLWPIHDRDSFAGPFKVPDSSPTPLVVATTYDPATPFRGAKSLVRDLGNARLLTMRGDGHTAYAGNSPCVDAAVEAYMNDGTLPAPGTKCTQNVPFTKFEPAPAAKTLAAPALVSLERRLHAKPLLRGLPCGLPAPRRRAPGAGPVDRRPCAGVGLAHANRLRSGLRRAAVQLAGRHLPRPQRLQGLGLPLGVGARVPPWPARRHRARAGHRPRPRSARDDRAADPRGRGGPSPAGLPLQARDRPQLRDDQHLPVLPVRAGRRGRQGQRHRHRHLPPQVARRDLRP